jgi:hypothetical protein
VQVPSSLDASGLLPAKRVWHDGEWVGGVEMKRLIIPIVIVGAILILLAFLTEGSAIAPFLYRNF